MDDNARDFGGRTPTTPLEPPYCQVVGRNAVVLLTREQIERIARDYSAYPITAQLACSISDEMHRALDALDASEVRHA